MNSFNATDAAHRIVEQYPSSQALLANLIQMRPSERRSFLRLWASEGIPKAFSSHPIYFDILREWMAGQIGINAKEITVIGSVRLGYSMAPPPEYGRPFDENRSDLDLSIISERCFLRLKETFECWLLDYNTKMVTPKTRKEAQYWPHNAKNLPVNIRNGFLDPYKIPTRDRYPYSQFLNNLEYRASIKLKSCDYTPNIDRVSIRVYRDWRSFIRQQEINLNKLIKESENQDVLAQ